MFLMCWKLTGKSYPLALPTGPAIASPAPRTPVVAIARATTRACDAILRELLAVPKRYTDLLAGLPGIGPNVLAARLHEMEAFGLLQRRTLPPPAASTVYELTELGQGLISVIRDLRRWGTNFLGPPTK